MAFTGSSRGLGRAFTEAVLTAGHSVVAGARNPDQLADLRSRFGKKIHPVALDVTSEAQAEAAVDAAAAHFEGLDVLVNNAGYGNVSPLRLLLGRDSYNAAEKSALDKLESDRKWKDLSVSTDFSS